MIGKGIGLKQPVILQLNDMKYLQHEEEKIEENASKEDAAFFNPVDFDGLEIDNTVANNNDLYTK